MTRLIVADIYYCHCSIFHGGEKEGQRINIDDVIIQQQRMRTGGRHTITHTETRDPLVRLRDLHTP